MANSDSVLVFSAFSAPFTLLSMLAIENLLADVLLLNEEGDAFRPRELALIREFVDRLDRFAFGRLFRLLKFNGTLLLSTEGDRLSSELTELLFAVDVTLVSTFEVPPAVADVSLICETVSMDDVFVD